MRQEHSSFSNLGRMGQNARVPGRSLVALRRNAHGVGNAYGVGIVPRWVDKKKDRNRIRHLGGFDSGLYDLGKACLG